MDKTKLLDTDKPNDSETTPCLLPLDSSVGGKRDQGVVQLKREVGLMKGVALIVGAVIGSGIFISPKGILMGTNSVGMSLMVWVICAVISTLCAMCYAELGAVIPRSGGSYQYILHAYGDLPAFLVSWHINVVLYPCAGAMVAITLGTYIADYVIAGDCAPPGEAVRLFALLAVTMIVFINCVSVRWSSGLAVIFSGSKVVSLFVIIVTGIVKLCKGHTQYLDPKISFVGSTTNILSYGTTLYYGFWAYFGWDILNNLSEEMINPERNIPLAIGIAMPSVTVIYLLTNIAYFTTLSPDELLASGAVAVLKRIGMSASISISTETFAERTLGPMAWLVPFGVCISTMGNLLSAFLSAPRQSFAAGREGHMLKVMSMVNIKMLTPLPAVMFQGLVVSLFIMWGDFDSILVFSGFISWMIYGASFASVLVLRRKYPDASRPYKVNVLIPIFTTLVSVFMICAPVISNPSIEYLYAFAILAVGLVVYFVFVKKKWQLPYIDHVTLFLQKLLLVTEPVPLEPTVE